MRNATSLKGLPMPYAARLIVAIAVALLPWVDAAAQSRTPPSRNPQKIVPKIGTVSPSNNAAALAALLVGPGVTISNATFSGDPTAAGTFTGGQASIGVDSGVVVSTGHAVDVLGPNQSDGWTTD